MPRDDKQKIQMEMNACIQQCRSMYGHLYNADFEEAFYQALEVRFIQSDPQAFAAIYQQQMPIPQIVLFNLIANKLTVLDNALQQIESSIIQEAATAKHLFILDVGVGRGVQMKKLLMKLQAALPGLESVTIAGIEGFQQALDTASTVMGGLVNELPFNFKFIPLNIKANELNDQILQSIFDTSFDCTIVNAVLDLHTINQQADRIRFFQNLASIKPNLITIAEPNVDCMTENFEERMLQSYAYYSALYNYTESLTLMDDEKRGLKHYFFNGFFDSIALADEQRSVKYERGEQWIEHASKAGFFPLKSVTTSTSKQLDLELAQSEHQYTDIRFRGHSLLSVITLGMNA